MQHLLAVVLKQHFDLPDIPVINGTVSSNPSRVRDILIQFEITSRDKEYPRLKAYVNYAFLGHLFFTVGVDDIFNSKEQGYRGASNTLMQVSGRDFFLGGGIYFTDDDLKAILSSVPIP